MTIYFFIKHIVKNSLTWYRKRLLSIDEIRPFIILLLFDAACHLCWLSIFKPQAKQYKVIHVNGCIDICNTNETIDNQDNVSDKLIDLVNSWTKKSNREH